MVNAGISDGSLVVVDRSLKAQSGDIVVAIVNNEFLIKRIEMRGSECFLHAENEKYGTVTLNENSGDCIWGVVTSCIQKFR
jgi:DNA polymerase V